MAVTSDSGVYLTHDGVRKQNKEDLLDLMLVIDVRDDNPLVKDLPVGASNAQTYHEWEYFSRARSTGGNAIVEGSDFAFSTLTTPTRAINYMETIDETFNISDDQAEENTVGGDEVKRRKTDALRSLMAKMEFEGIWASGNSGASNTARYMKGILSLLSKTTNASNPTVTEANWLNYLQEIDRETAWGEMVAYMDISKKKNVDSFTGGATRYMNQDEKRLINYINVTETTFGIVELYRHRDLTGSGKVIVLDRKSFKWAYKKRPYFIEPAPQGHYVKGVYSTKLTMEAPNPLAGIAVTNA